MRGRLGGHAPKSETRSIMVSSMSGTRSIVVSSMSGTRLIMVSSMGGNAVGDVVDGNVASKARDVGDNSGMTCRGEVFRGGVEYVSGMKVLEGGVENSCGMEVSGGGVEVSGGGVEYSGGMEVSSVERPITQPLYQRPPRSPARPRPRPPPLPLPRPRIGCILITVDDAEGLIDGLCDVDASLSYASM